MQSKIQKRNAKDFSQNTKKIVKEILVQNKLINLRKALKDEKIKYRNLKLENETINFILSKNEIQWFEDFFNNKKNSINAYFERYRSYELDYFTESNLVIIKYISDKSHITSMLIHTIVFL